MGSSTRRLPDKAVKSVMARQSLSDFEVRKRILAKHPELPDEVCGVKLAKPSKRPGGDPNHCQASKGWKTPHPGFGQCYHHGGCSESGMKFAAQEMGRALIDDWKQHNNRFGGDRFDPEIASITPEQAMLEEVRRSVAMVRFLEERIGAWGTSPAQMATIDAFARFSGPKDQATKDDIREFLESLGDEDVDSPGYLPELINTNRNTGLSANTNAKEWLLLYREERTHLARVSKMTIDAGVAQRLVTIAEDQGRILASAIRIILDALGLSDAQRALLPKIVPPVLRAVASDRPVPDISSLIGTPELTT